MWRDDPSDRDLLPWFSEEERRACGSCREHARVTLADGKASFCLACGALAIDGVRIDAQRRLGYVT